ncbi:two-component system VirA-like sensor kinase [Amorphus orientalis]|uniref:histidine kinase n=1 Tax=Amorphus orientalis TaxID=649198 RepID=A0AAE3VN34_9HYPH|nr:two-component system VirA-like sensor kinase [Amorphus orientalis]MDQ0314990.1 signal transduction histidine kinase [Amorphus orientalis]
MSATLILLALSWAWLHTTRMDARANAHAMSAFTDFVSAENGLHRAVLSARSGSLRNYDSLVRELDDMRAALDRLRQTAATSEVLTREFAALTDRTEATEALVERFKSTNALLHNSLAYFSRLREELDGTEPPVSRKADGLATAVLRLVVDPSPESLDLLDQEIARIEPTHPESRPGLSALIAHARQLRLVLPDMNATLVALAGLGTVRGLEAARAALLARQATITARDDAVRLFLYALSLVLVGLLAWAGIELRERITTLRRRAAIEHVIATISLRFLNAPRWKMDAHLATALEELTDGFGATRAYFTAPGVPELTVTHARGGPPFPESWGHDVAAYMAGARLDDNGIVHIEDLNAYAAGCPELARSGIASCLYIVRLGAPEGTVQAVLGFDSHRPRTFRMAGTDQLLILAFDALTNAVAKSALEDERERLEAHLLHARRMETVGVFASGIAHNFNNIIGAIAGHAEMAVSRVAAGSSLAGHIEAIQVASERARALVDQILGFGRRSESMRRTVRVDALLAETASLLDTSLPPKARLVVVPVPSTLVTQADPGQLQQVVLNLCHNAADAMDGDGTVSVAARAAHLAQPRSFAADVLAPGDYVVISVEDDGRGMDDATLSRIFEPFFTTRREGNGLGLATALEIARGHRGTITATSRPTAGSCFEIWLPAASADTMTDAGHAEGRTLQYGSGETVMLVEWDERQRMRSEEVLAALGYEPVSFADLERAVDAVRAAPVRFDAAVIFAHGGDFPGAHRPEGLHEVAPRLPIILSIEAARHTDILRLSHAAIAEVIPYPPTSAQLADALAARLQARRDPRASLVTDGQASPQNWGR